MAVRVAYVPEPHELENDLMPAEWAIRRAQNLGWNTTFIDFHNHGIVAVGETDSTPQEIASRSGGIYPIPLLMAGTPRTSLPAKDVASYIMPAPPIAPQRSSVKSSKRDAALDLAAKGFRVFPLAMNGKTPAHASNWQKLASSDPKRVHDMWTDVVMGDELDYNIGIALDRNTLVVDVDVRNGKQGAKSLQMLEAIYDPLPATYTVITASGGEHRYFRVDDSGAFTKILATDIDLKGEGGYVVGPGSEIDGRPYAAVEGAELGLLPSWVWDLAPRPNRERERVDRSNGVSPLEELDSGSAIKRATEWLATRAPEHGTYSVAAKVKDFGISRDTCVELVMDHWPPAEAKGEDHIAFRVDNAYAYGQNAIGVSNPEAEFDAVELAPQTPGSKPGMRQIPFQVITPFEAASIPRRQWVLGNFSARQYLSCLISPPGVGKTTFLIMAAASIASGKHIIPWLKPHEQTRVLLWNQEDELDELKRRLLAVMLAFDISWDDLRLPNGEGALIFGSGADLPIAFAKRSPNNDIRESDDATRIESYIRDNSIGAAFFDPFVELHPAEENNNTEIAAVGRIFRSIAVRSNCSIVLAHHSRKPREANARGYAGNMDSARGAGALNGVARMVATLYTMESDAAKRYGISAEESKRYVQFDDAKNNLGLISSEPAFFRRESVEIGGFGGEEIGILKPVELTRVKSVTESKAIEGDAMRHAVHQALSKASAKELTVVEMAERLVGSEVFLGVTLAAMKRRLEKAFNPESLYDNGDTISYSTQSIAGKSGRPAVLTLRSAGKP